MILTPDEILMDLSEEEIIDLRREEGRCICCGTPLKWDYETYDVGGHEQQVRVCICPNPKCG